MISIACAVERSVAIVVPARTPARTAVATASPSAVDEGAAVTTAQPPECEPDDEPGRPHDSTLRRRYVAVLDRFPQIAIEHQVDDAFREAS